MREHIEFIQSQFLPWSNGAQFDCPGGEVKLLSTDSETRAFSCLLRYPAGWAAGADHVLPADQELYVLDGSLCISGVEYREDSYAFLPNGYARVQVASPEGVTLLSFFSAMPNPAAGDPSRFEERRLVRRIDLIEGAWDGDFQKFGLGSMHARARMRVLRTDPISGENTYITATVPFLHGDRAERHPIAQEFFLLAGELAGNTGTMQAGAYCFRPPMIKHGPYGSRTGALILFRSLGGSQETLWEDAPPFTFTPQHAPFLPELLAALGAPLPRPGRT